MEYKRIGRHHEYACDFPKELTKRTENAKKNRNHSDNPRMQKY